MRSIKQLATAFTVLTSLSACTAFPDGYELYEGNQSDQDAITALGHVSAEEYQSLVYHYNRLSIVADDAEREHMHKPNADDLRAKHSIIKIASGLDPAKDYSSQEICDAVEDEINVMLQGLDSHSYYLSHDEAIEHDQKMFDIEYGLGFIFVADDHGIKIVELYNGPAKDNGIKAGDILSHIDGVSLKNRTKDFIWSLLPDGEGEFVTLSLYDQGNIKDITVAADKVSYPALSTRVINDSILELKLSQFSFGSGFDLAAKLESVDHIYHNDIQAVIIDLRGNGGGYVKAVDHVLNKILSPDERTVKMDLPIYVMVDNHTASSAEILAGTLQDYGRAEIIGSTKTYGKGNYQKEVSTGQKIFKDKAASNITKGLVELPNGHYQLMGINPDIFVPLTESQITYLQQRRAAGKTLFEQDEDNAVLPIRVRPPFSMGLQCNIHDDFVNASSVKIDSTYLQSGIQTSIDITGDHVRICTIDRALNQSQYSSIVPKTGEISFSL